MTSKKELRALVEKLNVHAHYPVDIEYARFNGGYQLRYADTGHNLTNRMPAREMRQYLLGALDWLTPGT